MSFSNYIPICDAIVRLMDPLVEIVIHDIAQNSIAYISGKLSNRAVGEASLLDTERSCFFILLYDLDTFCVLNNE